VLSADVDHRSQLAFGKGKAFRVLRSGFCVPSSAFRVPRSECPGTSEAETALKLRQVESLSRKQREGTPRNPERGTRNAEPGTP